jgi:DNA-binding response OmpR family regulator
MKLLVIEDDEKVAAAVSRGLMAEGFTVEIARDGLDGLWRAREGSYDLIVLDILLPGRNGYLVCRDLRSEGDTTPILMLTAKGGDLDEAEGLETGADDYLVKPFSFPVLVARIRALLRRAPETRAAPLDLGDLEINSASRRVWRHGREVRLTSREFDVLEYLARRAGDVVSKAQLLKGVWPDDFDGDPNIVEVYVRHLRAKLEVPFDATLIETVRGAGYRLEASS